MAAGKGLDFSVNIHESVPRHLIGDAARIAQILSYLTDNAVKFSRTGAITIRVEQLKQENDRVVIRFSVTDTGIGIERDRIDGLFQTLTQGDGSSTREFGGIGLGLSLSRRLIDAMGGRIDVDSEPGFGSTFSFELELGISKEAGQLSSEGSDNGSFIEARKPVVEREKVAITESQLLEHLGELEPLLKKRQPKKCAPLLEILRSRGIPGRYASGVENLIARVSKFQFNEATAILQPLIDELKKRTVDELGAPAERRFSQYCPPNSDRQTKTRNTSSKTP